MVGSAITTTTPVSRTDWYKETCTETSERKGLNCCQVLLHPAFIRSLAHVSVFLFFLAVSRPDNSNCHERFGECTEDTSPYAHTRTFSRCARSHARCDDTFGSRASRLKVFERFIACPSKIVSSQVMSLLNVPSIAFPRIFSSPATSLTTPAASPTLSTGIRPNPVLPHSGIEHTLTCCTHIFLVYIHCAYTSHILMRVTHMHGSRCLQCACRHLSVISCFFCSLTATSRPLPTTTSLTLTFTTSCRTSPT